jgi:putative iron-dependent peroxidase
LCFEFERILLDSLGACVSVVDEVWGFRYFDARDLLGFVDGTANPAGLDLPASALVGNEDADFAGGSYVVVQKYLHDLDAWARLPTRLQEEIIGRTKIDNIEIDDDDAPRKSHKSLATIVDADGTEYDILRDNMPFGRPGRQEFGTAYRNDILRSNPLHAANACSGGAGQFTAQAAWLRRRPFRSYW